MNTVNRRLVSTRASQTFCLVTVLLALVGCNDFAATLRQFTYPPDFTYVSSAQLQSSMQHLAYRLQQLDLVLATEAAEPPGMQQNIEDLLREIERIGSGLQAGEAGSNHPFLQDDMATFLASVRQARMAAALNPPRYYMAGRVSGGCVNCHRVNRQ